MADQERFLKQPQYYESSQATPSPYVSSLQDPFDRFGNTAYPTHPGLQAPPYNFAANDAANSPNAPSRTRHYLLSPRSWSKRIWLFLALGLIIIIVIVVVAAVEATKAAAYPDYNPLTYSLSDTFSGTDFFSQNFQYWDTWDTAGAAGFVHYDNPTDATVTYNTTYASADSAILRVDNKQTNASTGRHSARVSSIKTYNSGLFVFDILHFPTGCATWPAVWLTDQYSWPADGEIDVIEAVNQANTGNQMTLHTTNDCSMSGKREMLGKALYSNCYYAANENAGCGVKGATDTYGADLNSNGGGVYAMELRSAGIRVWFWDRASVPSDLSYTNTSAVPEPQTWGEALADFPSTNCDIGSHFKNLSIVANIDVCGSWAGNQNVYSIQDSCPGNCTTYAAANPAAFDDAYWEFKSFRVWQAS